MNISGELPIGLILLGLIAAFLILRLRSVLGKRIGFEGTTAKDRVTDKITKTINGKAEPVVQKPAYQTPAPDSAEGQQLAEIQRLDPSFAPEQFMAGAELAFRSIVTAFAEGNKEILQSLLNETTYQAFAAAIDNREALNYTQKSDIRALIAMNIRSVEIRENTAYITLLFVSDQTSYVTDQAGDFISGTEALTEMNDLWTFERQLGNPDPAWRLCAATNS